MFVFPDEEFTMCPPDDAEIIEPGCRVSKTKTKKKTAFAFLTMPPQKKALRIFSGALFVSRRRCANQLQ